MHKLIAFLLILSLNANLNAKKFDLTDSTAFPGFFSFLYDDAEGKIYLEVDKLDYEFLYVNSLPNGIGSNDIGLDRGQLGNQRIVKFERHGSKLLLVEPNFKYRADSNNPNERRAVEESFAKSVLWGFEIAQRSGNNYIIDITDFLMRDGRDIGRILKSAGQGDYKVDESKSALYLKNTKSFPDNSEFEVILTLTGEPKGYWIGSVTPTPGIVTVHQRHSFIRLPDDKYKPRKFDPRAGYFPLIYYDYSAPITESTEIKLIYRHRLEKKNPSADTSEPVKPIIYYVDSGVPDPVRSALIEGASWWNGAFEAAGFINAFQVKVLPENADPMDVRYNVIQWVHRSTRGWSYGGSITDPRTGEVIKGHISLGSLRVRQDFLIAQGLSPAYEEGNEAADELVGMALARIRQLSAHEVGHALGLAHNFTASAKDRASVMDYPHPYVTLNENGEIDLSQAYDEGIGEWDKIAIRYGYSVFTGNEADELQKIVGEYIANGFVFITDDDARAAGGAHPFAHLWDNGSSAVDELERILELRKFALDNFSEGNIPNGEPYSKLEDMLVPLYYSHRYQTEAAVKLIGGLDYRYALKGDNQLIQKPVDPRTQMEAFDAVLKTMDPEQLLIPSKILNLLPPRAYGYERNRESFKSNAGVTFDPVTAAAGAAQFSVSLLLNPERASRIVIQSSADPKNPSLDNLIERLFESTIRAKTKDGLTALIKFSIDEIVITELMKLCRDENTITAVREEALNKLLEISEWMQGQKENRDFSSQADHFTYLVNRISEFLNDPENFEFDEETPIPPGSPIGSDCQCGFNLY